VRIRTGFDTEISTTSDGSRLTKFVGSRSLAKVRLPFDPPAFRLESSCKRNSKAGGGAGVGGFFDHFSCDIIGVPLQGERLRAPSSR
jgi:hypothetical protein